MAQDVCAIDRNVVGIAQPSHEACGCAVFGLARHQTAWVGDMLNADTVAISGTGMPGLIVVADHLHYFTVLAHDVVCAHSNGIVSAIALMWILEPAYSSTDLASAVVDVDHNSIDGSRFAPGAIIHRRCRSETTRLRVFRCLFQRPCVGLCRHEIAVVVGNSTFDTWSITFVF